MALMKLRGGGLIEESTNLIDTEQRLEFSPWCEFSTHREIAICSSRSLCADSSFGSSFGNEGGNSQCVRSRKALAFEAREAWRMAGEGWG